MSKGYDKASATAKKAWDDMRNTYDNFVYGEQGQELVNKWEAAREAALNKTKEAYEAAKKRAAEELAKAEEALNKASDAAKKGWDKASNMTREAYEASKARIAEEYAKA